MFGQTEASQRLDTLTVTVLSVVMLFFSSVPLLFEILEILNEPTKLEYFKNPWNVVDLLSTLSFMLY